MIHFKSVGTEWFAFRAVAEKTMSNPEPTELRERREGWMLADLVFFPLKPFNNRKL